MSYEITGKLIVKNDTQPISEQFKKREFVLEVTDKFGDREFINFVKIQLIQNKCEIIDPFQTGDHVRVHFNIKGNRWEKDGRTDYFTNLDAWRIEAVNPIDNTYAQSGHTPAGGSSSPGQPSEFGPKQETDTNPRPEGSDAEDDLPF